MIKIKKVEHEKITGWKVATKTRPIKVKSQLHIFADKSVTSKFLLDTLEGREPLGDNSVICVGEAGDVWQQDQSKLLGKYNFVELDKDGWMTFEPRPDNAVECFEVTEDMCVDGKFYVIGQWGEDFGEEKNVQKGKAGDFICRNRVDTNDVWVVHRGLFISTYIIKS